MLRPRAILLIGPTGSGKTPLGQLLEERGYLGTRCVHFDFGESLRRVVETNNPHPNPRPNGEGIEPIAFSAEEIAFLRGVLESGKLLEDEQFLLAERILRTFLARRSVDEKTWVVLNGLPRHAGQADAVGAILDVQMVVCLECSSETVLDRLCNNVGGDREGRTDDDFNRVRRKLETFCERTAALVDYYRQRGVTVRSIPIESKTTPENAWEMVNRDRLVV